MHIKTAFVVLAALASASAIGCSTTGGGSGDTATTAVRASLHRAKSCGDLLSDLKADAIYKLNRSIDLQIASVRTCEKTYPDDQCNYANGGGANFGNARGIPTSEAAPAADASGSSSSGGSGGAKSTSSASSYSQTNTQVKGVDEADIVKNDGKNLYILHGSTFKVVNAWPANELKEAGSIPVEGTPSEMFVADGKVVVYSQVNGAAVFKAANVKPKEQYTDFGFAYGGGGGKVAVADSAAPYPSPNPNPTGETYAPLTKITVMALDGATPRVTREIYFEGNYLDARRVDGNVRSVFQGFQYGPKLKYGVYDLYPTPAPPTYDTNGVATSPPADPYPKNGSQMIAALEQLRAANLKSINESQLSDWLPNTFIKEGNSVSAKTVACEDFYIPNAGSTESGLTEVVSLDLADPASTPKETAILGRVDTVYGNAGTMYLAAHAWIEPPFLWTGPVPVAVGSTGSAGATPGTDAPPPTPGSVGTKSLRPLSSPATTTDAQGILTYSSANTHLHKFEFTTDARFPNYVASGTVVGSVKDQFSLDEKDGNLRIATTEQRQYLSKDGSYVGSDATTPNGPPPARPNTLNHVFVLGQQGPWLDEIGHVGDLAPNEQIYSVRFVEGRGYVVTFRQVDPLFVIDLQNPKTPTVLAALKIPGFSEYMHPLDANHLLTIGRDASATGRTQALQLQIFDVTNGSNPIQQFKYTYSSDTYGSSDAEYDPKAFTYFAEKGLLAFPYYSYDASKFDGGMRSSLELFKVDLTAGFTKLGSIDHTTLLSKTPSGYCGGYYGPSVRRGVFLENFVYSISYGGVVVKNANDLGAPGTQLALPSPITNEGYGPVCAY